MKAVVRSVLKYQLYVFLVALLVTSVMLLRGRQHQTGPPMILMLASLALYFMGHAFLRSIAFTVWVFAFVAASMFYPAAFGTWFGFELKRLIVPLIQVIMFGMGTTLSVKDFARVFTMPWPVLIGMALQYSVMPLAGLTIAWAFGFEAEIAAGVILIGSCPGGVASNLMTYLARGNVALSVTMTSCSTLMSPLITPYLMKWLAGHLVPIDPLKMMISILNMIIVPIVAGLLVNKILYGRNRWMHRMLPVVSMSGICFIIAIITAQSREKLLTVGLALVAAAILHNFIGYLFGYWCARLARLGETACRTVAIEVGLQNGGMASGLAIQVLKSGHAALAPAIFGPWMNISGSMLATWWYRNPVAGPAAGQDSDELVSDPDQQFIRTERNP